MTIDPALLVLLSALLSAGSAIAAAYLTNRHNLRITRLTKESEERKHQRELVISAAIENWKHQLEIAKASPGVKAIRPLDDYIIHMVALSDLLLQKPLHKDEIPERLNELQEFLGAVDTVRKKQTTMLR
jgi:hypothetical protein